MRKPFPLKLGSAFAITVAAGYAACTLVFWLLPEPSAAFLQALFHGLDFRPLSRTGAFSLGSFLFALAVLALWAFAMGALLGWVLRRLGRLPGFASHHRGPAS